jgi:hypothetical protein
MNISQEGATIAINIPMIKRIINVSSIVKPAAGVVALPLSVLFIDTWMHSSIFGWQKKTAPASYFFFWYIILTVGLGECLDRYVLKIYGNLKAGKERAFRTRRCAVSLQIRSARYIL